MEQFKESPRSRAEALKKVAENYFPRRFDFFGLGSVESVARECMLREIGLAHRIVMFQVTGDERGFCVVGFERAPQIKDESMLVEMANILVSKFANMMADASGSMVMISPPEVLDPSQNKHRHIVTTLKEAVAPQAALKRYEYIHQDATRISVRMAFVPQRFGRS